MTEIEAYVQELDGLLLVRGRARRRLLSECRAHLAEAGAVHGEGEAVRRFGGAAELAAAMHLELGVRRAVGATLATTVGVVATGLSTLVLVNSAEPHARAVVLWAVVFFASAQTAAVCTMLAVLQAARVRGRRAESASLALLSRRNYLALGFAILTLLAAGGAVPGHGSAVLLTLGPALAVLAAVAVHRGRRLVRGTRRTASAGFALSLPWAALMVTSIVVATVSAFLWDQLDHGSVGTSARAAAIEAGLAITGLVALGPALGLRPSPRTMDRCAPDSP